MLVAPVSEERSCINEGWAGCGSVGPRPALPLVRERGDLPLAFRLAAPELVEAG